MKLDPLAKPKADLVAASVALEAMKVARATSDLEMHWKNFLSSLEKVWIKVERCCQPARSRFEPWQGRYRKLRREDPLLRYLKEARDADSHTIKDISDFVTTVGVEPIGGSAEIHSLWMEDGKVKAYHGDPIKIVHATRYEVVPIEVDGTRFWPTEHLGQPVVDKHPARIGELGLEFYAAFVSSVQRKFFPADSA